MSELRDSHRKILDLYRELGVRELDVDTVARRFGWKKSTAKKYMDQLAKWGYLNKKTSNTYELAESREEESGGAGQQASTEREEGEEKISVGEVEVKPAAEVVESFYFHYRGSIVPLRASSLEQLAAIVKYKLITPEELAYAIRTGFLQTWIERSLHEKELARQLDELRGLSDQELFNEAARILTEKARVC